LPGYRDYNIKATVLPLTSTGLTTWAVCCVHLMGVGTELINLMDHGLIIDNEA